MECPNCKKEISENDRYCTCCGFVIKNSATSEVEQRKQISSACVLSSAQDSSGEKPLNVGSLGRALIFYGMESHYDETVVFFKQMLTALDMKVKTKGTGILGKDKNEEIVISGTEKLTWKLVRQKVKIKISRKGDDLMVTVGDDQWIYVMIINFVLGLMVWPLLILAIITAVRYYGFYPKLMNETKNFLMTKA